MKAEGLLYWTANCISKHATLHKLPVKYFAVTKLITSLLSSVYGNCVKGAPHD